jgi:hypothetical protein
MSIEQVDTVDFVTLEEKPENVVLAISDHFNWNENESLHLQLLQDKLNSCLRFIESGELYKKFPEAARRSVVINVVGKFPLSPRADIFFEKAGAAIRNAGFALKFNVQKLKSSLERS